MVLNFKKLKPAYFRNMIFGAEDSLVSTVGVLFGVASAGEASADIILTGFVVITVEALSMGAGSYLTESETQQLNNNKNHEDNPLIDGIIMFFAYFISGFIPLAPYFFFPQESAKFLSLALSTFALFVIGYIPTKSPRSGSRMAVIGGLAVLFGFVIAKLVELY